MLSSMQEPWEPAEIAGHPEAVMNEALDYDGFSSGMRLGVDPRPGVTYILRAEYRGTAWECGSVRVRPLSAVQEALDSFPPKLRNDQERAGCNRVTLWDLDHRRQAIATAQIMPYTVTAMDGSFWGVDRFGERVAYDFTEDSDIREVRGFLARTCFATVGEGDEERFCENPLSKELGAIVAELGELISAPCGELAAKLRAYGEREGRISKSKTKAKGAGDAVAQRTSDFTDPPEVRLKHEYMTNRPKYLRILALEEEATEREGHPVRIDPVSLRPLEWIGELEGCEPVYVPDGLDSWDRLKGHCVVADAAGNVLIDDVKLDRRLDKMGIFTPANRATAEAMVYALHWGERAGYAGKDSDGQESDT